ncbi:Chitin deacetylase 8 [Frankliniella fusca]|uniref:Chitin deacetylase 8 n=1 Tax=Frankliniella fusca TaxID=407009 RepID=A0AAE1HKN6_9NEOP|nr:Chitin deacetylase 8 [Frankliniella fusca]
MCTGGCTGCTGPYAMPCSKQLQTAYGLAEAWRPDGPGHEAEAALAHGQRRGSYGAGVTQATDFDCPEEFGYYPHPSDCTQYYVCVFGGALLESCTGGLMYSHELQTCDWPRNVGCGADSAADTPTPARSAPPPAPRAPLRQQPVLSREQQQQERRQRIEQEEIAKQQLYAEDLGPAEEVESDRQQRVYRGQPSSLGQVARDRDGLRHQPNTIQAPSTSRDKASVVSYATQQPPYSGDALDLTLGPPDHHNLLTYKRRKKRQVRRHATRRHLYSHPLSAPPQPPPPDDTPPHYRLLFDPNAASTAPPPAHLHAAGPSALNLSAFLSPRPSPSLLVAPGRPHAKASAFSHPVNEDLRPPPLRPADGNPDVHPMSVPYRTLPSDGDGAGGFVPIPNPATAGRGSPPPPAVSLTTTSAPATHLHFTRLESQTARPAAGTQITSPSSHVHEVSTAKLEAETSQSYINERGEKLHGNYRDPAPPGATVNGKTPLPPIPWVDERATASPVVSTGHNANAEHDDDDDDDDDDEDEDVGKKNKLSTKESNRNTVPSGDQDDEDEDDGFNEPDDEEFGPDSGKRPRRPNKNKKDEHESHIMISDFKLTTDPSPDHHHDDEETVTGAPEATLTRPSASQNHHHHDDGEDGDDDQHQNQEEDDDHDDDDFYDPDLDEKPLKHKKAPAQSQSQPVRAGAGPPAARPEPLPLPVPAPKPAVPETGFTSAQPGALGLDDDDDEEHQRGEYRPPESFFSDDFGKEFDNEDATFGSLNFDYDKFIKEMDKGVDDKVQGLANGADKAGAAPAAAHRPKDDDEAFFGDDPEDEKPSAPAQYPRTDYTSVPFSWEADGRKHVPGAKGKESGVYYDKYRASKSPFGSEAHRDMRYEKQGASTAKTAPNGFFQNPFADPNFNFERYVDTIAATTTRATVTSSGTTTSPAPTQRPQKPAEVETEEGDDNDDEDDDDEEEETDQGPTRETVLEKNTVKSAKHKPVKQATSDRTQLAKNHRYESGKPRPEESAAGTQRRPPAQPSPPSPAANEYEDMVSEEDKHSAPKYPRSTERSVRSTTPLYSLGHTTAYSTYPRRGPYLGEFTFEQASPNNLFLPRPRASAASSSAPRERFAERFVPSAAVTRAPSMAVDSSSFSTYGSGAVHSRRPLLGSSPRTASSNSVTSSKPRTKTKNRPQDDEMKEFYDVLGYTDEYHVENVHLAPTEGYDDLNPLKDIYPDIKAHIGLADHDDDGYGAQSPRGKANQYQVFEAIAESRPNRTTLPPPPSTPVPFTRPNNRGLPEAFRPAFSPSRGPATAPRPAPRPAAPATASRPAPSPRPSPAPASVPAPAAPANHKVTYHELTQTHPKTRHRSLTSPAPAPRAPPPPPQGTTPRTRLRQTTATALPADSPGRESTRDRTRTSTTAAPRRPDRNRPEPSAAPLQYSPQPPPPPQPQPSPTTGRSVFTRPANTSYQPSNYDQYYAVYDDDDQLYRDVDYGHFQNNQGSAPQPFSRGNNNQNNNRAQPQNVEIITQAQPQQQSQQQPQQPQRQANTYVSSSFNVQSQDSYAPTVSSQDYNDNYNVNVQYDVDDTFPQTKPTRGSVRGRGKATYTAASETSRGTPSSVARGSRPTLKPSTAIVSKAQEFVDIYKFPPSRPESVYPTPTPDKSAAKCRKDVCLLPDCNCGGKDIPGDLSPEEVPQIVLLTFDDSVNDLNKGLYTDLFEKGRTNPNGCPIAATFYVSHEWTDYSQVQNLYSAGHEIASHSVSHSFGEQFSQKKWTKEIAGQREILAAYGGVKQEDIRGMRAPFLAVGGNKMFKMLYDSNFTYDSSMPVYENKPPSWPYTLDYKLFHDCMIPPCPTRSYPGVWEVPMVMWTDLNGGRCSMGDACSNPPTADGVYKMLIKNFERHYTTNRAPFGLFYHAAWFTQPHHKEGFIAFLDTLVSMNDVWLVTNWQALQWVRDPTPISRLGNFQPFQCNYQDRPRRCNNPKVCNLWHKSGVRYMRTCQPCPDVYPWTGKSGVRNSRVDNDIEIV